MKILIITSNSIRHKYFANKIYENFKDCLIFSENRTIDYKIDSKNTYLIKKHFDDRLLTEKNFFNGNNEFLGNYLSLKNGEINSPKIIKKIKKFMPDIIVVFGSSILKDEIIRLVPKGKFLNMHLGISPYYRGSGTNFWPFVNNELEFVGATILYIDSGIDTGDIITHVRPTFEISDNVHTVGCKVIKKSTKIIIKIINEINHGKKIKVTKQWKVNNSKYYKIKDFDQNALEKYFQNLEKGIIKKFIESNNKNIKLVEIYS